GYRGHAQLAWQSPDGYVFGAEGILEGQGTDVCRLTNVAATDAVSVGDEIYTAQRASALPFPMYYGQVLEAELEPGALFWKILVKPAAAQIDMQKVQILTTRRNPARALGN
ncbi:MAG: rod shape-determining protein MreC, partial [Planctomycetaceae bacterium]